MKHNRFLSSVLTLLLILLHSQSYIAQDVYAWQESGSLNDPAYKMYKYSMFGDTATLLFEIEQSRFDSLSSYVYNNYLNNFEFSNDPNCVYFIKHEGDLNKYFIKEDSLLWITDLTPETTPFLVQAYTAVININFISDSILYVSGLTYGYYNIHTNTFVKVRQPANHPISFTPYEQDLITESLVHYKGDYLYTSRNTDKLMKHHLSYPDSNYMLLDLAELTNPNFFSRSLVVINYQCDSSILYFHGDINSLDTINSLGWYKLHPYTGDITFSHSAPPEIRRNARQKTYNQYTWEECQRRIDLDVDNSTIQGIDFDKSQLCSFHQIPLSDVDIDITNETPLDSIVIAVEMPTPSQRILINPGNYIIHQPSATSAVLMNNGSTTNQDFELAIKGGYFTDLNALPNRSTLITFTPFYGGLAGNVAKSYLSLKDTLPDAGQDLNITGCTGDDPYLLASLLSPNIDKGGAFVLNNIEVDTILFDEARLDTAYYMVTIDNCTDTSLISLHIYNTPTVDDLPDTVLCSGRSLTIDLSEMPEAITWNDGDQSKVKTLDRSDLWSYTIRNDQGCTAVDSFRLSIGPNPVTINLDTVLCSDQSFTFRGRTYIEAGLYYDTIYNFAGCDSIINSINIAYHSSNALNLSGTMGICLGASTELHIEGSYAQLRLNDAPITTPFEISASGVYSLTAIDRDGCTTQSEFEIVPFEAPTIEVSDLLDTVYTPDLKPIISYYGDIITYDWSPNDGSLECTDCPYPTILSAEDGKYLITVTNDKGCTTTESFEITFRKLDFQIPNAIASSPLSEGNSAFYIQCDCTISYDLAIYDRWGNLVYKANDLITNNASQAWKPSQDLSKGVYMYMISFSNNGKSSRIVGDITLF